ncbi:MAG: A/G-specific adenine glycosylase [Nocardioidaceae bacterium]|nr:A/G-specific adenine glycosylase [Nocardioidaceae bacterium]
MSPAQQALLDWYAATARDLPWRAPGASPWAVMVSEFMLQQTPVTRVLPVFTTWLGRWPTASALAADPAGEAVRAWGRLGYPRRALRLHSAARVITDRHAGEVPLDLADLRSLPGVGEYTAAAIASFAHRQRHVVLDTNVRRVLSRAHDGRARPSASVLAVERTRAAALLPADARTAARWSVAVMELGALVCAPSKPACNACPLAESCSWRAAGYPPPAVPARRAQPYDGTDRQCRGRLLALLQTSPGAVPRPSLEEVWSDAEQRERALDGLVADGLVESLAGEMFALPGL